MSSDNALRQPITAPGKYTARSGDIAIVLMELNGVWIGYVIRESSANGFYLCAWYSTGGAIDHHESADLIVVREAEDVQL
jgi:8-oxo-dGTP pyrophosphatase MutT (NUDIX family)